MFDNSPNPHPIKNLWWDMKIAAQSPSSPTRLELFCQDKWPKIAASLCARLLEVRPKRPASLTAAADGSAQCCHGRDWLGGRYLCISQTSAFLVFVWQTIKGCFFFFFYHSKHFSSIVDQRVNSGMKFIAIRGCKTAECVWIENVCRTWQTKIIWGCNGKCCPAEVRLI